MAATGAKFLSHLVHFVTHFALFLSHLALFLSEVATILCPGGAILEHLTAGSDYRDKPKIEVKMPHIFIFVGLFTQIDCLFRWRILLSTIGF